MVEVQVCQNRFVSQTQLFVCKFQLQFIMQLFAMLALAAPAAAIRNAVSYYDYSSSLVDYYDYSSSSLVDYYDYFELTSAGVQFLPNTDFYGDDLQAAGSRPWAASKEACAEMCMKAPGCWAASWNGPGSQYHNNICNMKTGSANQVYDENQWGIIIP